MTRLEDAKVLAVNAVTLSMSFTAIEMTLKITLLIASIVYTAQRIVKDYEERKAKKEKK